MTKKQHKQKRTQKRQGPTNKMNIFKGVGTYSRGRPLKGRGGYAEDIGSGIGAWLGKKAGSLFSSITGLGTYKVDKNTLLAKASDPPIVSNSVGGTRVQHREYIKDIVGSIGFSIESFPINPGIPGTFPWLASVANAYEEYRMHGILFEYKSTSATALNSVNTALGTVIMATEYNPLHPPFTAKRDMENYVYSTSSPPSQSSLHPVECARDMSVLDELFVRNVPLTGSDLRFSDIGNFQIATIGMQAAAVIGELWVTYDIELIKPKLPDAFTSIGPAHYIYSSGTVTLPSPSPGLPLITNLWNTAAVPFHVLRGTGVSPVTLNTNTMTFLATGQYMVNIQITGAALAPVPAITANGAGGVLPVFTLAQQGNLFFTDQSPLVGINSSNVSIRFSVNITTPNATVTIGIGAWGIGNFSSVDTWVVPLPAGFQAPVPSDEENLYTKMAQLTSQMDRLRALICEDEDEKYIVDEEYSCDPRPVTPRLIRSVPQTDMSASTNSLASALLARLTTGNATHSV